MIAAAGSGDKAVRAADADLLSLVELIRRTPVHRY
jgi:hypothetical protein